MSDCMAGTAVVVELLLVLSASVLIMGGGEGGKDRLLNAMVRSQVLWQ